MRQALVLAVLLLYCASLPHVSLAVVAGPVLGCWKALSYDVCTVQDATGICASKFQQDVIVDADYRRQLFEYLVERYTTQTVGTSIEGIVSATLSPLNTSYATYLDGTYSSACSTDSGVSALLFTGVSEANAETSRAMWLLVLQQASFCSPNEMWVLNKGCVCKEDKDCDELSTSEHGSLLQAIALVLAIILVIQIFTYVSLLRQIWAIFGGYDAVKSAIEFLSASARNATPAQQQRQKTIGAPLGGEVTRRATPSMSYASAVAATSSTPLSLRTSPSMSSLPSQPTRKLTAVNAARPSPPIPAWKPTATKLLTPEAAAVFTELHDNLPQSPFDA